MSQDVLSAIRENHAAYEAKLKDFGDIEAILGANPLIAAFFYHMIAAAAVQFGQDMAKRMIPVEELLGYPAVAKMMGKSEGAVKKMKERGQIIPIPHLVNGQTKFTKGAIESAIALDEIRQKRIREQRARNATTLKDRSAA